MTDTLRPVRRIAVGIAIAVGGVAVVAVVAKSNVFGNVVTACPGFEMTYPQPR
jgi:hypothetical protein